jgi:hypothetical protein
MGGLIRSTGSLIAVIAALLVIVAPAAADRGCRSSTSKGAKILAQTRTAVVFVKDKTHRTLGTQPIRFGCMFRVGRTYRLTPFTDFDQQFGNLQLAGRYAAFHFDVEEGAGNSSHHTIRLYDLRTGRGQGIAPGSGPEPIGSELVQAIVLKPNGSIAWISSFERKIGEEPLPGGGSSEIRETVYPVTKIENGLGASRANVEEGTDIDRRSLALSRDRQTIYWIRGGVARSAPLR